jgi:hypothetical protein
MKPLSFVLGFTIIVLVLIAGCSSNSVKESVVPTTTSSLPPYTTIVTTTVGESPVTTSQILTPTPSSAAVNTTSANAIKTIATPIHQSTKTAADDPFINNLQLKKYAYGISDCVMIQAFPDIANDPDYGLKSANPKLVGISSEKWNSFYQDWITGKNTGQSQTFSTAKCRNVPYAESTTWDVASVEATITSRNAKSTNYTIIVTISSNGKEVAQLLTNETLTNTQELSFLSWIPIKRTEIGSLDKASINFNKISNI